MKLDKYYSLEWQVDGEDRTLNLLTEKEASKNFLEVQHIYGTRRIRVYYVTVKDITQDFEEVLNNDRR